MSFNFSLDYPQAESINASQIIQKSENSEYYKNINISTEEALSVQNEDPCTDISNILNGSADGFTIFDERFPADLLNFTFGDSSISESFDAFTDHSSFTFTNLDLCGDNQYLFEAQDTLITQDTSNASVQQPIFYTEHIQTNINQDKLQTKVEKRSRGRPKTSVKVLEEKEREAEEENDKFKLRISRNNKASKIYRDKRYLRKIQLNDSLERECRRHEELLQIHAKQSEKILKLKAILISLA